MADTRLTHLLRDFEQSPWLDNIRRGMLKNGEMQHYIDEGIVGVTANPTIFEKAIGGSSDYDDDIHRLGRTLHDANAIYEALAIQDIQDTCDLYRPVYERSGHMDGRVSLEVLPELANNTAGTIAQAQEYWDRVSRPNAYIKIPATAAGVPAIEEAIYRGLCINVTLIFAISRYREVMNAYLRGLERRVAAGRPIRESFSVASFFVSRVDTLVDKQLQAKLTQEADPARQAELKDLLGKAAIANAKLAYAEFEQTFSGPRWAALAAQGANVQRPLWASTSTKNPDYPDTIYVDNLIGPHTVNTMPPQTIAAVLDHGRLARTLDQGLDDAQAVFDRLAAVGIHMDDVTRQLEIDGVQSFSDSFDQLRESIRNKTAALVGAAPGGPSGA